MFSKLVKAVQTALLKSGESMHSLGATVETGAKAGQLAVKAQGTALRGAELLGAAARRAGMTMIKFAGSHGGREVVNEAARTALKNPALRTRIEQLISEFKSKSAKEKMSAAFNAAVNAGNAAFLVSLVYPDDTYDEHAATNVAELRKQGRHAEAEVITELNGAISRELESGVANELDPSSIAAIPSGTHHTSTEGSIYDDINVHFPSPRVPTADSLISLADDQLALIDQYRRVRSRFGARELIDLLTLSQLATHEGINILDTLEELIQRGR